MEQRYRSFYPVGEMLIGLRFHELNPDSRRMGMGRTLKIIDGKIIAEQRANVMFTPPLVPHHSEHGYGFWHVNDEQEMVINLKMSETPVVTVLAEGFPKRGRHDRFAWYCLKCLNPLYMREVETGRVAPGLLCRRGRGIQDLQRGCRSADLFGMRHGASDRLFDLPVERHS